MAAVSGASGVVGLDNRASPFLTAAAVLAEVVPTPMPAPDCVNPGSAPSGGTDYAWVSAANSYQTCQQAGSQTVALQSVDGSGVETRQASLGNQALLLLVVVAVMAAFAVNWIQAVWRGR